VDGDGARAADLALARACATGDPAAIALFEERFGGELRSLLSRLGLGGATVDELAQELREKLFVGRSGAPPAIASYAGRGPLGAWLRAMAVHAATSAHRAAQRRTRDRSDSLLTEVAVEHDVELLRVRAQYAPRLREALQRALAELSPRQRNVLRLVYVEEVSVEQVAVVYGVHRVSVSRWLGDARRTLLSRTRALLAEALELTPSELESVTRACLSQLELSLDTLLRD
jgi:RNA polymerase sigma-70 factor (ECF subfamily)